MQPYVTPHPGRSPGATTRTRIVQRDDYQLDVKVTAVVGNQWRLQILKYIPETDWTTVEFYLTDEQLALFKEAINGS